MILQRMKEWGMHPVLPGYSGMIPSKLDLGKRIDSGKENENSKRHFLGIRPKAPSTNGTDSTDRESYCPTIPSLPRLPTFFDEETEKLYGTSDYYSIDPFHEAKSLPAGLDFGKCRQGYYGCNEEG